MGCAALRSSIDEEQVLAHASAMQTLRSCSPTSAHGSLSRSAQLPTAHTSVQAASVCGSGVWQAQWDEVDAAIASIDMDDVFAQVNARRAARDSLGNREARCLQAAVLPAAHTAALAIVEEQAGALATWPGRGTYNMQALACGRGERSSSARNHLGNSERFMLYTFLVANGVSPELVAELFVASSALRAQSSVRHVAYLVAAHRDGKHPPWLAYNVLHAQWIPVIAMAECDRRWFSKALAILAAHLECPSLAKD